MKKPRKSIAKRLKNDLAYLGIRMLVAFFRFLPRGAALAAGSLLGRAAPYLARRDFRRAVEHLKTAFGGEKSGRDIVKIARESFRQVAMNFVDTVRLRVMNPEEIRGVCVPHGLERLKDSLAKGRGVIGLTSHTGCWELLGAYLAAVGMPIAVVARRLYDPRLEEMLLESRTHGGMVTISRGRDTRDIIRVLKKGYLLGILIDQDTKVKGAFVDFFGVPAYTATAPAVLSLRYGSPILPIMTYRDGNHRHHICIGEPVEIEPTGDHETDVLKLTEECSKATERFIREHPEQWVWFHRRWKTKPGTRFP